MKNGIGNILLNGEKTVPLYEYISVEASLSCSNCENGFEEIQGINEERLSQCPRCGNDVKRLLNSFAVNANSTKDLLSNKNLEKNGFTKYQKVEQGVYEKSAGEGPRYIKR